MGPLRRLGSGARASWSGAWARAHSVDGIRTIDGRGAGGSRGHRGADHGVLCLAVEDSWPRGLGVELSLPAAVAAYYRSLFLNVTLPGGVVGDVHRGVSHGRDVNDVGRALRGRRWERFAGQVVQVVLTARRPPRAARRRSQSSMPLVAVAVVVGVCRRRARRSGRDRDGVRSPWARLRSAAASDIRDGLLARRAWLGIALASALVVAGHAITFLIAARTAGTTAPPSRMLPIALLVMMAMVLPERRRLGTARGRDGMGVRRGRPRCAARRHHRSRLRRHGVRR